MKVLYAGSFDPFTIGHLDIARRAIALFDHVFIGIGYNENKRGERSVEDRVNDIKEIFKGSDSITVEAYSGLTSDYAKKIGADALLRGVRNGMEFENEKELADINLEVLGMPTIMLPARPSLSFVSSSMVRELSHNGFDVTPYFAKSIK